MHADLSGIPLFQDLSPEQRSRLAEYAVVKHFVRDHTVFVAGAPADGLYALKSGLIKIVRYSPDGKEAVLHLVRPGQLFAEVPVFRGGNFPACAVTVEASVIVFIPRNDLLRMAQEDPEFSLALLAALSLRLHELVGQIERLNVLEASQRLAAYILYMSEMNGGRPFELDVSRSLLASMLGSARETLSRSLTRLKEAGAIALDGRRLEVLDADYLRDVASGVQKL